MDKVPPKVPPAAGKKYYLAWSSFVQVLSSPNNHSPMEEECIKFATKQGQFYGMVTVDAGLIKGYTD